jgi:hypothetical protein
MTRDPLFVLVGLADRLLTRLCAVALPWSNRSQHDAYLHGYREGLKDGVTRREMGLRS